jgi:hypothetical protein
VRARHGHTKVRALYEGGFRELSALYRRLATAAMATSCMVFLAGCGESTITITDRTADTNGFVTVSATITSDASAISAFTKKFAALSAGQSPPPVIADGGAHAGSIVCTYRLSKGGHDYTVTIYVVGPAPGAAALCSTANQKSLQSQLP